ncbi:hypothetical protein LRY29_01410 [Candidatus Saccharibacteria bacterium]|nr:hypothetical protein [Candidatus Saccharibacteria bacterium]
MLEKKIFGQDDVRFWLHKQHVGDMRSARHWYFSQHPKRKDQQPVDIHYEREPGAIHKLYAGNEHQMSQEEVDRFVEAVQQYAQIVATDVYNTKSKQDYGLAA